MERNARQGGASWQLRKGPDTGEVAGPCRLDGAYPASLRRRGEMQAGLREVPMALWMKASCQAPFKVTLLQCKNMTYECSLVSPMRAFWRHWETVKRVADGSWL